MFTLSHVKKSFGDNPVLRDVSIKVNDGDVVAVLGPSGSGKTTLLRAASYLTRADGGTVELDGEIFPLNKISRRDLLRYRRKTGFVFQNFNLFANKTVLQNVTAGLTIARKMPRDEAEAIAIDALKRVGILDRKDYYPSKLSGGQQQRVAIARAIAPKPSVLFFDEPTSALDPQLTGEVLNVMKSLADDGTPYDELRDPRAGVRPARRQPRDIYGGRLIVEQNTPDRIFTSPEQQRTAEFLRGTQWLKTA